MDSLRGRSNARRLSPSANSKITLKERGVSVLDEPGESGLGERELALLQFESRSWPHPGAKEESIRESFDLSAARYYQLLNVVIDSPEALRQDPILVRRLQRIRDVRARARASRVFTNPRHGDESTTLRPNESTK